MSIIISKVSLKLIWEKAYNTIANCNVLIQNTEAHGNDFFYEGENEKIFLSGRRKGFGH